MKKREQVKSQEKHTWLSEKKDHWLWLILSFLGDIIKALLVKWLS